MVRVWRVSRKTCHWTMWNDDNFYKYILDITVILCRSYIFRLCASKTCKLIYNLYESGWLANLYSFSLRFRRTVLRILKTFPSKVFLSTSILNTKPIPDLLMIQNNEFRNTFNARTCKKKTQYTEKKNTVLKLLASTIQSLLNRNWNRPAGYEISTRITTLRI